jgi:hypothetical protein
MRVALQLPPTTKRGGAEMSNAGLGIDLSGEFMEAGRSWSEFDDDGMVVRRNTGAVSTGLVAGPVAGPDRGRALRGAESVQLRRRVVVPPAAVAERLGITVPDC